MNRSRMRRQLYKGGGIADLYPRQKYGFGSWVKKKIRNLIPNELADVAVKAAPFVAMVPGWGPAAAGIMRGVGRFDQRGSISDALKQGIGTYAGGKLFGKGMEHMKWRDPNASGIREFINQPTKSRIGGFFGRGESTGNVTGKVANVTGQDPSGLGYGELLVKPTTGTGDFSLKEIYKKWQGLPPGLRTAIVGTGSGTLAGIAQWFENQIPQEPGESMEEYIARRKVSVGKLMRQYMDNTRAYDAEWTSKTEEEKEETVAQYNMNKGGRVGQMYGTGPQGLPGIPRMAPDGMEYDMSVNGGFQPLGAKEGKDDVPAMLAKNEFVFTADAVRGAGNGDIELGAQKMYDTMKKLEGRVA